MCGCKKPDDGQFIISGLDNFRASRIKGIYNIILVKDTANMIIVSGHEHLSSTRAEVVNDTLNIEDSRTISLKPGRNNLELHFREMEYLETLDAVNVTNTDTINAESFSYAALGEISEAELLVNCDYVFVCTSANTLGNIKFRGKAGYFSVFNRYGSSIIASDLKCREVSVTSQSIANDYINASELLQVYIEGPGNIYYSGNPLTDVAERIGTGNLLRIN